MKVGSPKLSKGSLLVVKRRCQTHKHMQEAVSVSVAVCQCQAHCGRERERGMRRSHPSLAYRLPWDLNGGDCVQSCHAEKKILVLVFVLHLMCISFKNCVIRSQ